MCMSHHMRCECGLGRAELSFRDNVLNARVVSRLYCPTCSPGVDFDPESMLSDNGWVLKYDMALARSLSLNFAELRGVRLSPEAIFDEGYATWLGMYPGELVESRAEREELKALSKTDPREYFRRMRQWANSRMERFKEQGWRKALAG